MADGEATRDGLDDDLCDKLIAIGKGVAGAVPLPGGVVAEIVVQTDRWSATSASKAS